MHKIILGWIRFWRTRRALFGLLLVAVLGGAGYLASQLRLTTDIRKTLPEGAAFSEVLERFEAQSDKSTLFVALDQTSESDALWSRVDSVIDKYVDGQQMPALANLALPRTMYQRLPGVLTRADYEQLDSIVTNSDPEVLLNRALRNMSSPGSWFQQVSFVQDPFGLLSLGYDNLAGTRNLSPFEMTDGGLLLADGSEVNIYTLRKDAGSDQRVELLQELLALQSALEVEGAGLQFYSPALIEAANVSQIREDVNVTMTIAIGCILIILFIVYRHWIAPLLFLAPAAMGIVAALAAITLLKQELSAIAMGSAVVIFGIVLDYSFHFFTSYRRSGSLREAIEDVSNPLLTSCLTTVLAFLLLLFTTSPVLRDFGLFAALSLAGAAISVLFVLPVFLSMEIKPVRTKLGSNWTGLPKARWLILGGVVLITAFFVTKLDDAGFDANLYNLNYYPDWLQQSEQLFTGVDPDDERRLLFRVDESNEAAIDQVKAKLDVHVANGNAKGYFMREVVGPGAELQETRNARWLQFWSQHAEAIDALTGVAQARGFSSGAFEDFRNWASSGQQNTTEGLPPSYVIVSESNLPDLRDELDAIAGVEVVDLGAGWRSLVVDLKDNFNLILIGTSLLVFFILLLVYGRIELTLITFLPMALSWVWIVGATAVLGIEFNFISIVLATFIFGLGDDFAIFMTNAHLEKYKAGRGDLVSNRLAIFLSATTTLIGMAALLGAEHPALRSLSGVSIVGIIIILGISLIVQPIFIRMLITDHTRRGVAPLTLLEVISSIITFGLFAVFSVLAIGFQLILRLLPGPRRKKSRILRSAICYCVRFILFASPGVRFRKIGAEHLDFTRPSVVVANHQAFVDILRMVSLSPDLVILTKKWVYYSPLFGPVVRYAGYLYVEHGFEENEKRIGRLIEDGCSIMIFPEGTRSPEGTHKRWQKGALYISEMFKLDVTPIVLHGYGWLVPPGGVTLRSGIGTTIVLPRIRHDDETYGIGYRDRTKAISKMFRKAYDDFHAEHGQTQYQFSPVLSSFIYKGPVVEWYFRVKWMLERKNYERIDHLLSPSGNIYDLGCGMGYIALYLHLRQSGRKITGVDYDNEKIALAKNHYLAGESLQFESADIRRYVPEDADGILLGDVLHYLGAEDQTMVLNQCVENLNPGGTIVIRDGLRSNNEKHKRTIRSEHWSTRIYKFNKTDTQLHFFDKEYLQTFAREAGLQFDQMWESDTTSNALCVLKKV